MPRITRFMARHLGKPAGWFGRWVVGRGLARRNRFESEWTVSLLGLRPEHWVLEIGFGPGVGVARALELAPRGTICGIDLSPVMVEAARKRIGRAHPGAQVDLRLGDVAQLPWPDASFDRAFTVHCIYFWKDPVNCLKEILRVLVHGGSLGVTIRPKSQFPLVPSEVFTLYDEPEITALFQTAGFRDLRLERTPHPLGAEQICVIGRT